MRTDNYVYMSVDEASKYLGVSRDIIYPLCRVKNFPAAKVGKHWRIRRDLLDRWWEDRYEEKQLGLIK